MFRTFSLSMMGVASLGLGTLGLTASSLAQTSRQTPANEVSTTRTLNTEVSQRNLAADRHDAAAADAYRAAMQKYEADLQAHSNQQNEYSLAIQQRDQDQANEQLLYNQRMAKWRAAVVACERGEREFCAEAQNQPQAEH